MAELQVVIKSGISADGFDTIIKDNNETISEKSWYCGYDYTGNREHVSKETPYVTDVLQGLIDKYHVNELSLKAGMNTFTGKEVPLHQVEAFKSDYCTNLQFADAENTQDFADAVAAIPVNDGRLEQ